GARPDHDARNRGAAPLGRRAQAERALQRQGAGRSQGGGHRRRRAPARQGSRLTRRFGAMELAELTLRPLQAPFGAEVTGIDLRSEPSAEVKKQILGAWHKYGLLVFRDQDLDEDQHLRVASIFGEISTASRYEGNDEYAESTEATKG